MTAPSRVLWALDNEIGADSFERLCTALLYRSGFRNILPVGGTHDDGRDAEEILQEGHDEDGRRTFFQYSLEKKWESKLRRELNKVKRLCHQIEVFVFVTTSTVTARKLKSLRSEVKRRFGWTLQVFYREFLRHNLEEVHPDLADRYLGIRDTSAARRIRRTIRLPDPEVPELRAVRALFDSGQYEAAIPRIKDVMAITNRPALCWVLVADAEYILANYARALQAAEKALESELDLYEAKFVKGCILVEHGIASKVRAMIVQGRQIFGDLIKTSKGKKDSALAYNLANALSALQEYQQAVRHYRRCLERNQLDAQAWKNLGSCYHHLGNHEEEFRCLDRALAIDPDLPEALLSKGQTLGTVYQNYHEGVVLIAKAIEADSDFARRNFRVYWWKAKFLMELRRDEEAIRSIDEGLKIAAGDQYLLDLKATALAKMWRGDVTYVSRAREFFRFRIEINEKDFASLVELAEIARKGGEETEAKDYSARALNLLSSLRHRQTGKSFPLTWSEWDQLTESIGTYVKYRSMCPIERELFDEQWADVICDELWLRLGVIFSQLCKHVMGLRANGQLNEVGHLADAMTLSRDGVQEAFILSVDSLAERAADSSKEEKISLVSALISGLCEFALFESPRNISYLMINNGIAQKKIDEAMDVFFARNASDTWVHALIEVILATANARLKLLRDQSP